LQKARMHEKWAATCDDRGPFGSFLSFNPLSCQPSWRRLMRATDRPDAATD
jgi:hypothetical protein